MNAEAILLIDLVKYGLPNNAKDLRLLYSNFKHPGLWSYLLERAGCIIEVYVDAEYGFTFERRGNIFISEM